MEEGKEPATTVVSRPSHSRALPQRLVQLLALFLVFCFAISLFSIYMIRKTGVVTTVTSAIPILQPCILEQPKNNLDRWITPPSNLMHTMSDKELFWRASFVPQLKKYPFARVPKIAFMFLTKGPLPLAPLWERFFNGHKLLYSIYIHSLPSYEPRFPYTSVFYGRQIPSQYNDIRKINSNVIVIGKTSVENDKEDFENDADEDEADNAEESEGDEFEQETG